MNNRVYRVNGSNAAITALSIQILTNRTGEKDERKVEMWIFSIHGFYSIACASKPDGSLDTQTVMIRARRKDHLQNLQKRFPVLAAAKIITLSNVDYRHRIVVPKSVWAGVLSELAEEIEWSNFKNKVAAHQGKRGAGYSNALHEVWQVMYRLQEK
jgi:hypothetical protein